MIRRAQPADVPAIYQLIRDLAEYERGLSEVTATEEDVRRSGEWTVHRLTGAPLRALAASHTTGGHAAGS